MRGRIVVFAALIATPGTARAGRTFYGWLLGTEVMPERGAEVQTFVDEENLKSHENDARVTDWWVSPFIGITDQIEIGFPVELEWARDNAPMSTPHNGLDNYGAELRWRLVSQDPVDKPAFAPLVRVGVQRLVTDPTPNTWQPELDVIGSYETGDVHVLVDLGMIGTLNRDKQDFEFHPGAGISVKAYDDVRVGAEVFAEIPFDNPGDQTWVAAGPNLAWSHGRSWISAAYGIGLYHIQDAPRLNWGIAF